MKIKEKIFNAETGIEEIVERDATDVEIAEAEAFKKASSEAEAKRAQAEAKREAALAKLEALGLTAEDLKAIGL